VTVDQNVQRKNNHVSYSYHCDCTREKPFRLPNSDENHCILFILLNYCMRKIRKKIRKDLKMEHCKQDIKIKIEMGRYENNDEDFLFRKEQLILEILIVGQI